MKKTRSKFVRLDTDKDKNQTNAAGFGDASGFGDGSANSHGTSWGTGYGEWRLGTSRVFTSGLSCYGGDIGWNIGTHCGWFYGRGEGVGEGYIDCTGGDYEED